MKVKGPYLEHRKQAAAIAAATRLYQSKLRCKPGPDKDLITRPGSFQEYLRISILSFNFRRLVLHVEKSTPTDRRAQAKR